MWVRPVSTPKAMHEYASTAMKYYTKKIIIYIHHLLLFVRHAENHHGNGCPPLWASCSGKQAFQKCLLQQGVAAVVLQSGKRENSVLSATHLQLSSIKTSCIVLSIVHMVCTLFTLAGPIAKEGIQPYSHSKLLHQLQQIILQYQQS